MSLTLLNLPDRASSKALSRGVVNCVIVLRERPWHAQITFADDPLVCFSS